MLGQSSGPWASMELFVDDRGSLRQRRPRAPNEELAPGITKPSRGQDYRNTVAQILP
jgi:hypothetical protein